MPVVLTILQEVVAGVLVLGVAAFAAWLWRYGKALRGPAAGGPGGGAARGGGGGAGPGGRPPRPPPRRYPAGRRRERLGRAFPRPLDAGRGNGPDFRLAAPSPLGVDWHAGCSV